MARSRPRPRVAFNGARAQGSEPGGGATARRGQRVSIVATAQDGLVGMDPFAAVAERLLAHAGLEDAHVRFLHGTRARRTSGLTCHVYAGSTALRHADPAWSWASPEVQTPEQLQAALESALRMRGLVRAPNVRLLPTLDTL